MAPDTRENLVHVVLGHSYLFYFLAVLIGVGLHALFDGQFLTVSFANTGMAVIVFGTVLLLWAQNTSRKGHKATHPHGPDVIYNDFTQGPYRFTRSPTHFGLGLVLFGLALVFNSLVMLITAVCAFFVTHYLFIKQEERLLEQKFGEPYRAYKKKVRF